MNNQTLPGYLAFGKLNKQSIQIESNVTIADYELLGERVMQVKVSPERAEIYEYFNGKRLGSSFYPDLETCVKNHFFACPIAKSEILYDLVPKITRLDNIYFQYPKTGDDIPVALYYPAISLFIIRVPVTDDNRRAVDAFLQNQQYFYMKPKLCSGIINFRYKNKPDPVNDNIDVLQIITPVAFLYERVKLLAENRIFSKRKIYRAIIEETISAMSDTIRLFYGTESDEYTSYSVFFKALVW